MSAGCEMIKSTSKSFVIPLRNARLYSSKIETPTVEREPSSREKAELVSSSLKSIFDGFLTTEESYEPVDIKPILANPRAFAELNQFHRDQITDDLTKRFKQKWQNISPEYKRLSYFVSYGNYGPREELQDNLFANVKPEDLPFASPAAVATSPLDKIHKLPEVDMWQSSPLRQEQFRKMTRRLDPMSKTVVYLALIISLLALYRDKTIGEDGMVIDVPESPLLLADIKRQQDVEREQKELEERQLQLERSNSKKWYFLWLR